MSKWDQLENCRIIRLNARLMPVFPDEAALYRRYHLNPLQVEAATPQEIIPYVADCDGLFAVSVKLPEQVIDALTKCRVIARLGTGTDRIDTEAAKRRGIIVANVPEFCTAEMADHTMAMLLSLARQLPRMSRYLYNGEFARARDEGLALPRIAGQTLGLVGFGASAKAVAVRARAFGLRVLATRRNMNAPRADADALGVEMMDLDAMLPLCDFVSLHLPLAPDTYHLFDEARLRRFKRGAFLINTARGALVDERALARLLREGYLAGAGIDTFSEIEIFAENPQPPTHPLTELENVILTPHVSGLSFEAMEYVHLIGVRNLVAVLSGYLPPEENIVNKGVAPRVTLAPYDASLFANEDDE